MLSSNSKVVFWMRWRTPSNSNLRLFLHPYRSITLLNTSWANLHTDLNVVWIRQIRFESRALKLGMEYRTGIAAATMVHFSWLQGAFKKSGFCFALNSKRKIEPTHRSCFRDASADTPYHVSKHNSRAWGAIPRFRAPPRNIFKII